MPLSSDALERLPRVDAVLNYLTPMNQKPHSYTYEPPPGVPQTNARYEPHEMPIHDVFRRLTPRRATGKRGS